MPQYSCGGNIHNFGLVTVLVVPQNTYGELWVGSGLKPDSGREAFVLLRVIVLQADLQLHCFQKLPALALVLVQDFPHRIVEGVMRDFAAPGSSHRQKPEKSEF